MTFGDPSLDVRLGRTQTAAVEGPRSIRVGQRSATWTVLAAGRPSSGSTVTLLRESDGVMVVGQTNQEGVAEIDLSKFGTVSSQLKLFVYGPDLSSAAEDVELVGSPNRL